MARPGKPRYRIEIEAPVNGRVGPATVLATGADGTVLDTDRGNLIDAAERKKVSRRMAAKLGEDPGAFQVSLEAAWNAELTRARQQPPEPAADAAPPQAQALVALGAGADLFHTPEGEPYATVTVEARGGRHGETLALRSRAFRRWVAGEFFARHGKPPGGQALQDALNVLEGRAVFAGAERQVFVRLAEANGAIYLDLADADWRAVRVTARGWSVVTNPPVRFRRPRGLLALPEPGAGGSVNELRGFVNVDTEDDWRLLVPWLLAALRPKGPYPVLVLHGEQGSAKSTTARFLRAFVDPNTAALRPEPREVRDLVIAANNGWLIALDNLSHLPPWISDSLCRLSTGGGFGCRELYSDAEEVLFDSQRPVILTSIEELATRGDLLDRAIVLHLPAIREERCRPEAELWRAFDLARPRILGALLDAVAAALRELPSVRLDKLPRMADFALWATAAEGALGWKPGSFVAAYTGNRGEANELALEASALAGLLRDLAAAGGWEGTCTALLERLAQDAGEKATRATTWPRTPRALGGALRRLSPNLRRAGVRVELWREPDARRRRMVRLRQEEAGQNKDANLRPNRPFASGAAADGVKTGLLTARRRTQTGRKRGRRTQTGRKPPRLRTAPTPRFRTVRTVWTQNSRPVLTAPRTTARIGGKCDRGRPSFRSKLPRRRVLRRRRPPPLAPPGGRQRRGSGAAGAVQGRTAGPAAARAAGRRGAGRGPPLDGRRPGRGPGAAGRGRAAGPLAGSVPRLCVLPPRRESGRVTAGRRFRKPQALCSDREEQSHDHLQRPFWPPSWRALVPGPEQLLATALARVQVVLRPAPGRVRGATGPGRGRARRARAAVPGPALPRLRPGQVSLQLAGGPARRAADSCRVRGLPPLGGTAVEQQTYRTLDKFDRMLGGLEGLPDVTKSKPSTVTIHHPLIGEAQTFIIQTFRQKERGDTIFVQYLDSAGSVRIAIPPAAADAITRQRDALTTKVRKRVGKEQAQARKARGEVPAFLRGRNGQGKAGDS
jgi:hypothetical protein